VQPVPTRSEVHLAKEMPADDAVEPLADKAHSVRASCIDGLPSSEEITKRCWSRLRFAKICTIFEIMSRDLGSKDSAPLARNENAECNRALTKEQIRSRISKGKESRLALQDIMVEIQGLEESLASQRDTARKQLSNCGWVRHVHSLAI